MSKMLSREVRTYWKDKVSSKFSDRESAIETEDHNRINEIIATHGSYYIPFLLFFLSFQGYCI